MHFFGGLLSILSVACLVCGSSTQLFAAAGQTQSSAALSVHAWNREELTGVLDGIELPVSKRTPGQGRVVIIGLDGMTGCFYERYIREGVMPNIHQLMKRGSSGVLTSTIIPSSAVAWTAATSGVSAGRSGISSFFVQGPDAGHLRLVNGSYRRVKALWDYLDDAGRVSIVINVPSTFPPEIINGLMITGLLSQPGMPFTHPAQWTDRLRQAGYQTSDAPISPVKTIGETAFSDSQPFHSLDEIQNNFLNQAQLTLQLYHRGGWDLLFVVFTISDRLQHSRHLLPEEILRAAYINLDRIVGSFAERLPPDTHLILCSDHGFKPYPRAFLVNRWLANQGFTTFRDGRIDAEHSAIITADTVGNYAALQILPSSEPATGDHRHQIREKLVRSAQKLIDPATGKPVIRRCIVPDETARSCSGNLVDVILELDDSYMCFAGMIEVDAEIVELKPHIYDHDLRGMYAMAGPRIAKRTLTASIEDICAAGLYLLDERLPGGLSGGIGLDGKVRTEWLAPGAPDPRGQVAPDMTVLRPTVAQQSEDSEEVMDRLRALGYVQ